MYNRIYPKPDTVILAAGFSYRFGSDKLLALYRGKPLIMHTLASACAASGSIIIVASKTRLPGLLKLPLGPKVRLVVNDRPEAGMFVSLKLGLSCGKSRFVFILPGDCPLVPGSVFFKCLHACSRSFDAVLPSYQGQAGHPVLAARSLVRRLVGMPDESRLDEALSGARVRRVEIDNPFILKDVDIPQDLAL